MTGQVYLGGADRLVYYRLHGSRRVYYSPYSSAFLDDLAMKIRILRERAGVWCLFDNTAAGFAQESARALIDRLAERS